MNRRARAVLAFAALAAALGAGAGPASAHTELERTDPLQAARLAQPPAAAVLTFTGDVQAGAVRTRLVDPKGTTTPAARVDGSAVVVPVRDAGPGAYRVEYRVVSGDGHAVSGTLAFEVYVPQLVSPTATRTATPSASPPAAPAAAPSSTVAAQVALAGAGGDGGGPPGWLVAVLAVAGLAGASGAAVLATRRGGRP